MGTKAGHLLLALLPLFFCCSPATNIVDFVCKKTGRPLTDQVETPTGGGADNGYATSGQGAASLIHI